MQQPHSSRNLILAKEKAKPNLPGTLGDKGIFLKRKEKLQSNLTTMRKKVFGRALKLKPKNPFSKMRNFICAMLDKLFSFYPLTVKGKPPPSNSGRLLDQGNLAKEGN